jgi:hypothetical protein
MADDVTLETDAFLMKGERPEAQTVWLGNPAEEMLVEVVAPDGGCERS